MIKIMEIARREPKSIGSCGWFIDSKTTKIIGEIKSIRCNSDGNCVSILSDYVRGSLKLREADCRLHIYDTDRDVITSYDFGVHSFTIFIKNN